jgi:peptidoglycan hydrolase-like protein with peptidoglycan-binding domain
MKRRYVSGLAGLIGLVLGAGILTPAAAQAAASPVSRTLAQGAGMGAKPDSQVRRLQQILRAEGRSLGPAGVDGRFGPATAAAVRSFQQGFGLAADGIVGPKTRKLLRITCRADGCGSGKHKVANRSGSGRKAGVQVPSSGDSAALSGVVPAALVALAILLAALAISRWRHVREKRAYTAPSRPFPAVRLARRPGRRVIGYLGAVDYALTAAEEEAEEQEIERECKRRDWMLLDVVREVAGGGREALAYALDMVEKGDATCLVVSRVESVASSPTGLARVLTRLKNAGGCFVALDAEVDTTTREGAVAAALLVAVTGRARERGRQPAAHVDRAGYGARASQMPVNGQAGGEPPPSKEALV